jgi:hypothetical protein
VQVSRQLWLPIAPNSPLPGAGGNVLLVKGSTGRGIESITQPSGPSTALVTYTDATTSNLSLPSGALGPDGTSLITNGQGKVAANFGTVTGRVADGGALTATTTTANTAASNASSALSTAAGAYALANLAQPAATLPAYAVSAATTGALPVDNPAVQAAVRTIQQIAQDAGTALQASVIANNANLGTTGQFWNAIDAAAGGGTVNIQSLMQAAINWSATNLRPVYFPPGVYAMGSNRITISQNRVHLIFHPFAYVTSQLTNSSQSMFTVTGNHVTVQGGKFGPVADTYGDWYTGLILTNPDLRDWRTVCFGNFAGLANYGAWQTSTTTLFLNNTNILYFDALPTGYSLASLQAQANAAPIYIHNNQYVNYGSYIANGAAITAVTINSWSGYQAVLTPPTGSTYAVGKNSAGAIAALARSAETTATPAVLERAAIAAPSVIMLSGPSNFYVGGAFNVQGNHFSLMDAELLNCKGGRMVTSSGTNRLTWNCRGLATDGNTGSAVDHVIAGSAEWFGGIIHSGDQGAQLTVSGQFSHGAFNSTSNQNIVNSRYIGLQSLVSLSAQCISISLSIPNYNQAVGWSTGANPNVSVGNVITLPGPIPSGLTLSQFQQSAQAWQGATAYSVGNTVVNNNNLYTCTGAGTSSATGNGPTSTGGSISDGTVTWAYTSAGATLYCTWPSKYIAAPSVVTGIVNNGGGASYTITLAPPTGSPNAIYNAITTTQTLQFISGAPLGALTASIKGCSVESCNIICPSGIGLNVINPDSTGVLECAILNNTFDCTYAVGVGMTANTASMVLNGGVYGGMRIRIEGNTLIRPPYAAISSAGNLLDARISRNQFDPPTLSTGVASVSLAGMTGGYFKENIVWGQPGGYAVQVGHQPSTDLLNQTSSGNVAYFDVEDNVFRGAVDGQSLIQLNYGQNRTVFGNRCFQASALGAGNAGFASVTVNASGDICDYNDLSLLDGPAYTLIASAVLPTLGFYERYNPAPYGGGSAPAVPTPTILPALSNAMAAASIPNQQRIASALGGTVTIASATNWQISVELSQVGTASAVTMTLPTGAFNGQQLLIETNGAITALTMAGAASNWTNGAAFPAKTGFLMKWSTFATQWELASAPP